MLSLNDNRKLPTANDDNLKFKPCRQLPKFSGQCSSATDLPTQRKTDCHVEIGLRDKICYRASMLVPALGSEA